MQKIFHIFIGVDQYFIFKLNIFNVKKELCEVNFCDVRCGAFMTSSIVKCIMFSLPNPNKTAVSMQVHI